MMGNETRHVVGWLVLPAAAAANGALRDATYGKRMGRTAAHSLAVVPLMVTVLAWAAGLERRWPLASRRAAAKVGVVWLALTLAFEFGMGAARGTPAREMLAEYDVRGGHVWPLVPLAVVVAPVLVFRRTKRRTP
jgi:hypothetical protein